MIYNAISSDESKIFDKACFAENNVCEIPYETNRPSLLCNQSCFVSHFERIDDILSQFNTQRLGTDDK